MSFIHTSENYADLVDKAMDAEKAEDEKTIWPPHIKLVDKPNERYIACENCFMAEDIRYAAGHIEAEREFIGNHLHGLTGHNV